MEMVRYQALESKGSPKLSGACGKLLCCLKYELQTYRELKKSLPKMGSLLRLKKSLFTTGPAAEVIGLDILNKKIKVRTEEGEIAVIETSEIDKIIKEGYEPPSNSYDHSSRESDLEIKS
jgi:cell fate regulator YaaT (PSP1 superfamily)